MTLHLSHSYLLLSSWPNTSKWVSQGGDMLPGTINLVVLGIKSLTRWCTRSWWTGGLFRWSAYDLCI